MILTCPNCNDQFNIDDDLLGDNGRKVKCASCKEIWFQESERNTQGADDDDDAGIDDIDLVESDEKEAAAAASEDAEDEKPEESEEPEDTNEEDEPAEEIEVSDDVEDDNTPEDEPPPLAEENSDTAEKAKSKEIKTPAISFGKKAIISMSISALLFLVILSYLLLNSTPFMKKYPSTYVFYKLFGASADLYGKGLIFDNIDVSYNGEKITIDGQIINLEAIDKNIPIIEVSLIDGEAGVIAQWYITPPQERINAEESLAFSSIYNGDHDISDKERLNVQIKFIIMAHEH